MYLRLLTLFALLFTFTCCEGQWAKILSRLFEETAESAAARAARLAGEAAARRAAEEAFWKSIHESEKRSTLLKRPSTEVIHADELTESERKLLDDNMKNLPYLEKWEIRYLSTSDLRKYINNSKRNISAPTMPDYEFYKAPALDYSQATVTIQNELRQRGYKIQVDGRYGNETKLAVSKALKNKSLVELSHENAFVITKEDLFNKYRSKFIEQRKMLGFNAYYFNHNNYVFLPEKFNKLKQDGNKEFIKFFDGFFSKFSNHKQTFRGTGFVTVNKIGADTYVGYHANRYGGEGLFGRVINYSKATKKEKTLYLKMIFDDTKLRKIYTYGDDMEDLNKIILGKAAKKNITVITRNTGFPKSFNSTEASLKKLRGKKINAQKLTFMNGTPNSAEDVAFQGLDNNNTELFQNLYTDLNVAITAKNAIIIDSKEALITEITSGSNDLMIIVAHSDGNNIYFGNEMISIEDLKALPVRKDRKDPRTAIIASCTTGNVFIPESFVNDTKSFAQILLEKNYFDLIIAPPGNINGNDALQIIDIIDKYPVLQLNKHINSLLENGQMINLARIFYRQRPSVNIKNLAFFK
jgi:peptidoglycan hydrolase-like protein with peptidoglycan-binding domain